MDVPDPGGGGSEHRAPEPEVTKHPNKRFCSQNTYFVDLLRASFLLTYISMTTLFCFPSPQDKNLCVTLTSTRQGMQRAATTGGQRKGRFSIPPSYASSTLGADGVIFLDVNFTFDANCTFAVHEVDINITLNMKRKLTLTSKKLPLTSKNMTSSLP